MDKLQAFLLNIDKEERAVDLFELLEGRCPMRSPDP